MTEGYSDTAINIYSPIKKNEEFLGKNACYLCDDTWDRTPADRLWVPSAIEIKNRCNAAAEDLD